MVADLPSAAVVCRDCARRLYRRARRWRAIGFPEYAASLEAEARDFEVQAAFADLEAKRS